MMNFQGDPDDLTGKVFDSNVIRRFAPFLAPFKGKVLIAVVTMLIATGGDLLLPYLFGKAVDEGVNKASLRTLFVTVAIFLGALVVSFFARWLQFFLMAQFGNRVIYDLRDVLFKHQQIIGLKIYDRMGVGRMMSRIENDVAVLEDFLTTGLIGFISDTLILVGVLGAMLALNWRLALISFIVMPIMVVMMAFWRRRAVSTYRATRRTSAALTGNFAENISGLRVVQSFERAERNFTRFRQINQANLDANADTARLSAFLFPAVEVLSATTTAIVLFFGGRIVIQHGGLSLGALFAFLGYVTRFFQPVRQLSDRYNTLQASTVAGERIFELLDQPSDILDAPDAYALPPVMGEVRFDHVSFGYQTEPVLRDLNITISPGQTVAFVGATGAGKSSLVNLVPRFYDIWDGSVTIDGHDVREVTLESLRGQIGVVLQDPYLFSGTVRDNIRYGLLQATDDAVEGAARTVGAHDFIMRLPDGYDTDIRERGGLLSVGQRQLLSFARMVLANRPVVIMDEATSSVDTQTERLIQHALKTVLTGRTSLVIAHRLSTIVDADQIIVLDHGRIMERGTHAELLALRGYYYNLHAMQFRAQNRFVSDEAAD